MLISRKIAVKVVVTEEFKASLIDRLRRALSRVDQTHYTLEHRGQQFLSELMQKDQAKCESFRRKLDRQLKKQAEIRTRLAEELARAEGFGIGDEYIQNHLNGLVEIQVGDNLSEKLDSAEILVRDGKVVEIHY